MTAKRLEHVHVFAALLKDIPTAGFAEEGLGFVHSEFHAVVERAERQWNRAAVVRFDDDYVRLFYRRREFFRDVPELCVFVKRRQYPLAAIGVEAVKVGVSVLWRRADRSSDPVVYVFKSGYTGDKAAA